MRVPNCTTATHPDAVASAGCNNARTNPAITEALLSALHVDEVTEELRLTGKPTPELAGAAALRGRGLTTNL